MEGFLPKKLKDLIYFFIKIYKYWFLNTLRNKTAEKNTKVKIVDV